MSTIVLETERLLLRTMAWEDLDALSAIFADPQVTRFIGAGDTIDRAEVERYIRCARVDAAHAWDVDTLARLPQLLRAKERNAQFSPWAAVEKQTGQLIGRCGL